MLAESSKTDLFHVMFLSDSLFMFCECESSFLPLKSFLHDYVFIVYSILHLKPIWVCCFFIILMLIFVVYACLCDSYTTFFLQL